MPSTANTPDARRTWEVNYESGLLSCMESDDDADKYFVANLTCKRISEMSCRELAEVVQISSLNVMRGDVAEHLTGYDRPTLQRLAYLARRCCRNQGY